jgi:hypothetical protein
MDDSYCSRLKKEDDISDVEIDQARMMNSANMHKWWRCRDDLFVGTFEMRIEIRRRRL